MFNIRWINLVSKSVLQCIEEAIDNNFISIEISRKDSEKINKHKDFCLIVIQNPNKGLYMRKRKDLGIKFLSRLQIIYFPKFINLLKIAEGLAYRLYYKEKNLLNDLVSFNIEWSESTLVQNDVQCFTIRDIEVNNKVCSLGETMNDTIQIIYGVRYSKDKRIQLKKFQKYKSFENLMPIKLKLPKIFETESIVKTIYKILFSLKNKIK